MGEDMKTNKEPCEPCQILCGIILLFLVVAIIHSCMQDIGMG